MDRQSLIGLNHFENKNGIIVIQAPSVQKAVEITSEIVVKYSDLKTALFLSGFVSPKLFEWLAKKEGFKTGAVLQVEDFYSEKLHKNSRKLLIKSTGLLNYFDKINVRFYPIIQEEKNLSIEQNAKDYDEALRFILKYFPKSIGILTIDKDFQTAGITKDAMVIKKMTSDQSSLVSFDNGLVTLNFNALRSLDLILLLVIGQERRDMLNSLLRSSVIDLGKEIEKFPAKFYLRPEIAKNVILITDQII